MRVCGLRLRRYFLIYMCVLFTLLVKVVWYFNQDDIFDVTVFEFGPRVFYMVKKSGFIKLELVFFFFGCFTVFGLANSFYVPLVLQANQRKYGRFGPIITKFRSKFVFFF